MVVILFLWICSSDLSLSTYSCIPGNLKVEEVCNQVSMKNGTYTQTVLLSIEDNKNGPSV